MADDKPDDSSPFSDRSSHFPSKMAAGDVPRRTRTPPTIDLEASRSHTASDEANSESHGDESREPEEPEKPLDDGTPRVQTSRSAMVAAAVSGALAAVVIGGAAWLGGWFSNSNALNASTVATIETLAARVARLETVPFSPPQLKPDPALNARLDAMEKSQAAMRDTLAALRKQSESISNTIDQIKSASPQSPQEAAQGVAAVPDLSSVEQRITQLDARTQDLASETAQIKEQAAAQANTAAPGEKQLKRVIAATSLDLAVRQGEPFAPALRAATQLADDATTLKPLDAFVATGVPSAVTLSQELLALLPQLEPKTDTAPAGARWFDRLQASAERLVKIRRTDAVAGDDPAAVLSRAAVAARRNDVEDARRELMSLPQADRAKAQPWIDRVEARDAALAASRQFAAAAVTALAQSAP